MKEQRKTLICIPCLLTGGTEIQTLNTVQALVQGGNDVTVACYFEHSPEMVARYHEAGAKVELFSPNGERVTGYRSITFLYKHLRRIVKQVRPDVAHVQYMTPGATVILLLWLMGVKNIIATAHTAGDIYKDLRLIHFLQRHCLRAFTCITELAECSFFGTSQLYTPETVLKKRNHFTIHNCLSINNSRISIDNSKLSALNSKPNSYTLGVVSRLEKIKGMDLVVPAFAKVLKEHPNTHLIVVGDGSLRATMEQQATELNCAGNITWVGRQPQEELAKWYSQMDIVLMPSRSEGFGLTAIEAMSNGCVMVASNVGGLPEVVRDGICGLLHNSEDIKDMADKISMLINDKETYNRLQTQSLTEVEKYSFKQYAKLINDLYKRLQNVERTTRNARGIDNSNSSWSRAAQP